MGISDLGDRLCSASSETTSIETVSFYICALCQILYIKNKRIFYWILVSSFTLKSKCFTKDSSWCVQVSSYDHRSVYIKSESKYNPR